MINLHIEPIGLNEAFPRFGTDNNDHHNGWILTRTKFTLGRDGKVTSMWMASRGTRILASIVGSEWSAREVHRGDTFESADCLIDNAFLNYATELDIENLIREAKDRLTSFIDSAFSGGE